MAERGGQVCPDALTNAICGIDPAYQKFFKEYAGYPKFKSKRGSHKSYTTNYTNGNIAVDFENGKVKLPKLKNVRARIHTQTLRRPDTIDRSVTSKAACA